MFPELSFGMPSHPSFEGLEYKCRKKLNKPESNYVKVKKIYIHKSDVRRKLLLFQIGKK